MNETKQNQISELFIIAIFLALVGGFLDAYTYVCRDQVFANAQTGNIVRMGIAIANSDYLKVLRYIIPIVAFSIGVILTMLIKDYFFDRIYFYWKQIILIIEMIVVFIVGWIPTGHLNALANIMISFICAMQAECFRKVLGKPFSSTMCTGNLRSGTEYLYQAICYRDKGAIKSCLEYVLIILFFILGAVLGVWITNIMNEKAILICILPMGITFSMMFKNIYSFL